MEQRIFRYGDFRQTDAQLAQRTALFKFDGLQKAFTDGAGNRYWFADTTAASVIVNLPRAKDGIGKVMTVKRLTAGVNTLTVNTDGGNIDGAASHAIVTQYESYSYMSDGDNYWII